MAHFGIFGFFRNFCKLSQARGLARFAWHHEAVVFPWMRREEASRLLLRSPSGNKGEAFSRPMLPARTAPPPGPRQSEVKDPLQCICLAPTVTWLGGRGDERRQPRPGGCRRRGSKFLSVEAGGVHLPAPFTEIAPPQDAKLSAAVPEPWDPLRIMRRTSGMSN